MMSGKAKFFKYDFSYFFLNLGVSISLLSILSNNNKQFNVKKACYFISKATTVTHILSSVGTFSNFHDKIFLIKRRMNIKII